jgi:cytochrome bd-type quinol oxidase subunit 2
MQPKRGDHPNFPRSFWIPIIGYYLNLRILPPVKRRNKWAMVFTALLLAALFIAFLIPFHPVIPTAISLNYIISGDLTLLVLFVAIAITETLIILHSKIRTRGCSDT